MGIVECISINGCRLWFHSSDHLPPHFHCKKVSEWEIRVYFMDCNDQQGLAYDIKWGQDPGYKFRKKLNDQVLENRLLLLGEWEDKVIFD